MRFVLLVEGELERKALPKFFKKWLDPHLKQPIRIEADPFQGLGELIGETPRRAKKHLGDPRQDVIAVIGLFDLHGAVLKFPKTQNTVDGRIAWAIRYMEQKVRHPRFRQFVAVHETEAWLLSDPAVFPEKIRGEVEKYAERPEAVNGNEPPGGLVTRLYRTELGRRYRKPDDGFGLFGKLDPQTAYAKCPNLKALLDEMLRLAREAGL